MKQAGSATSSITRKDSECYDSGKCPGAFGMGLEFQVFG